MAISMQVTKKEWYKHGWGLLVTVLFFPYFLIWYAWAKSSWSKNVKIILTSVIALIMLPIMIGAATTQPEETTQQNSLTSQEDTQAKEQQELEAKKATEEIAQKEAADKLAQETEAQKKIAEEAAAAAATQRKAAEAATNSSSPSQTTAPVAEESSNLPLKAICNDGSVSYQDTPSKPDYRGMCSGHDGIKTKLGRVQ